MPEDYYPNIGEDEASAEAEPMEEEESEDETESTTSTALLPKSVLGGDLRAGDTVTLKIVHLYEDEAEVKKVTKSEPSTETPPSADYEIDQMAGMGKGME